ncbi:MAG: 4-hydroxy-tetrahydrodipicolinate reductase, partial [Caulobacterales bacterium]
NAARMTADLTIAGATERQGSALIGTDIGVLVSESAAIAAKGADVWIDFTAPAATLAALDALKDTPVRAAIIGTTGFEPAQEAQIAKHAERIALVRSGNFSLGVNMLAALVKQAAQRLGGADWDIEVFEAHHRRKVDAPSGTALLLGAAAAAGRGKPLSDLRIAPYNGVTGPRPEGKIGFSVSRAGGIVGEHEVTFASEREVVRLSHVALDRAVFADGALAAARWAADKKPGLYSMADVLGL